MNPSCILLVELVATFVMLGIFWFAQIVHYPLYQKIKDGFVHYERSHIKRTTALVGPLLIIDIVTSIMLLIVLRDHHMVHLATGSLVMTALTWLLTLMFQVQQYQKLSIQFSKTSLDKLLAVNWMRTIVWTTKAALVLAMLIKYMD